MQTRPLTNSTTVNVSLFNRLFELQPRTKAVFGIKDLGAGQGRAAGLSMMAALIHAKSMIRMIDSVLSMVRTVQPVELNRLFSLPSQNSSVLTKPLFSSFCPFVSPQLGPDLEVISEILSKLGKRHVQYGVKAHYLPYMGEALIYALKQTLKEHWTEQMEEAWVEVYDELSGDIMKAILNCS